MTHEPWTTQLWNDIEPIFAAILAHPFLTGLTDGTLDSDVFAQYVAQDVHYLRDYARALSIVAAKAPTLADTAMFARHAADVFDVELALHSALLPELGLDATAIDAGAGNAHHARLHQLPPRHRLRRQLRRRAGRRTALLLDLRRGRREPDRRGSADRRYQRWIDSYGGEEFAKTVADVLKLTDRTGPTLSQPEKAVATAHFVTTARYEWMFFDAAYRREAWPV